MRRAGHLLRRDENDPVIADAARQMGWYLYKTSEPADYLGCLKSRSHWYPIEIKAEKGKFTDGQKLFRSDCLVWKMPYLVWHSVEEMVQQTNALRAGVTL